MAAMMNEHTAKAFDVDLQDITRMVAEMGGLAEKQIADAIDALAKRDAERARRAVAADPAIDALQHEIEERAVLTIARRQPMAVDLREIVGALRVANDLERIGDLSKNIGKRGGGDLRRLPPPEAHSRRRAHVGHGAWPAQGSARQLRQPRPRQGDGGCGRAMRKSMPCAPLSSASSSPT